MQIEEILKKSTIINTLVQSFITMVSVIGNAIFLKNDVCTQMFYEPHNDICIFKLSVFEKADL